MKQKSYQRNLFVAFLILPFFLMANESKSFEFTFSANNNGWVGEFTNYWVNRENDCELAWGWIQLPTAIPSTADGAHALTRGLYLVGMNRPDDLFMFIKRQIEGLSPNTLYSIQYSVLIESNVGPGNDAGIGGMPSKALFKVGAASEEPQKIIRKNNGTDYYFLNVDKGNHAHDGANAIVIANIVNPAVSHNAPVFLPLELTQKKTLHAKTDSEGKLWLFLGTDSGYEGLTMYYIAKIRVTAAAVE